jgi:hypothetical protein
MGEIERMRTREEEEKNYNTQEKERGKANIFAPSVAIMLTENEKKERVVKRIH